MVVGVDVVVVGDWVEGNDVLGVHDGLDYGAGVVDVVVDVGVVVVNCIKISTNPSLPMYEEVFIK